MHSMNQPLVSVIVPVYKAETTIHRCVDSLLAQTLKDFEIVLVDDGSPDRCGEICDEYARNDSRIKVIHQKNMGVSAARQAGIDNATGEYTIHADPDDWVESTELEELYMKAKDDDADMVICDFYENDDIYHKQEPSSLDSKVVLFELFQQLHGSCCNKLVRRACYSDFGVRFPKDIYFCEDKYVLCSILVNKIKVSYLAKAFYHYIQYPQKDTLVRHYDEKTYSHDLRLINIFAELLKNYPIVCDKMKTNFKLSMTLRAFYNGRYYYDSKLFKERFHGNKKIVSELGCTKDKIFVSAACMGYYKKSFMIYSMFWRIKQTIKNMAIR